MFIHHLRSKEIWSCLQVVSLFQLLIKSHSFVTLTNLFICLQLCILYFSRAQGPIWKTCAIVVEVICIVCVCIYGWSAILCCIFLTSEESVFVCIDKTCMSSHLASFWFSELLKWCNCCAYWVEDGKLLAYFVGTQSQRLRLELVYNHSSNLYRIIGNQHIHEWFLFLVFHLLCSVSIGA